jgi:putative heme-binding domain-containing protein
MNQPIAWPALIGHIGCLLLATISHANEPPVANRPDWIWADAERHEPHTVVMRREFEVHGAIQQADLRLAADFTRCKVQLGERVFVTLDDYGPWMDIDITDGVRSGHNLLELRCEGSLGPSAIACELVVTTIDGSRQTIRSGIDWQTRGWNGATDVWNSAHSFGAVNIHEWDADRNARITPFDNYEQWRQATGNPAGADPAAFVIRPGFEIERVHDATDDQGSWVSMEFDGQGRLIVAREDKGLLRMTLAPDGTTVSNVDTVEDSLLECRGLLFQGDSLYAQANNTKGLYRLDDRAGRFAAPARLREFAGGVGHGRNDLALDPDGMIFAIFGDSVELPTDNIIDHTSPLREARRGEQPTEEGHVLAFQPRKNQWHLFCSGLRNPFGIDFNSDGEAFTYDADAEFDMGSPWYRPTRLVHLVPGGDYGWRGRTQSWPPYDADHADFTLPSGDIGKGSPTAVKSGARSKFPEHYRRAMFALDWAYGRILACHLVPRGAGYVCRAETFLKGRPLNVTDLDFGPDGHLYLITGGRKTHSTLYRVRWTGEEAEKIEPSAQQLARESFSRSQRELHRNLSTWANPRHEPASIDSLWKSLGSADPTLRDAARRGLEQHPVDAWSERAFQETRPSWLIPAMLAIARSEQEDLIARVLDRLLKVDVESLTGYEQSMLLETWRRCLMLPSARLAPEYQLTVARIGSWYPDRGPTDIAPTGAGRSVNHQLALLVEQHAIPDLITKTLRLLENSKSQEERLHAVFVLRNCREGWSPESRRIVFETLGELDRTVIGGEGMPGFLRQIREELVATLDETEVKLLGDLIQPGNERQPTQLTIERPTVKPWSSSDLELLLDQDSATSDATRGEELFRVALCSHCHRVGNQGGVSGPELTSVASRFGKRDLLLSILEPSRVVDEKYRTEQIVTSDGRVLIGRIISGGDYRSTRLRLVTDPLRPGEVTEIDKSDVESHQASPQSPMPAGLLDTLTPAEIADLLAYLESAGRP